MNKETALKILKEMQKWRRAEMPYDAAACRCPYTPEEYGEALDVAIAELAKGDERDLNIQTQR